MTSTSLQLNQLLGDATPAYLKKGGFNIGQALEEAGRSAPSTNAAFESLLTGLLKGGRVNLNASVLLGAAPANATAQTAAGKAPDQSLEDLLKGLPPEIQAMLRAAQMTADTNGVVLDQSVAGNGILDALSTADGKAELFAVIDDPKLAAALAGLNAQIAALKNNIALSAPVQGQMQNVVSPAILEATAQIKNTLNELQGRTITIASLDGDQFTALKKIAFADIAPFLTQPRSVVIDGRNVAKIAQGPSFLNEDGTDVTILALNAAALAAVIPAQQTDAGQTIDLGQPDIAALLSAMKTAGKQGPADAAALAAVAPAIMPVTGKASDKTTGSEDFVATGQAGADAALAAPAADKSQKAIAAAILAAATANNHQTPAETSTSHARGSGDVISDFAHASQDPFKLSADSDLSGVLKPQTEVTAATGTSSLLNARAAGQPHPGMHLVSVTLQRNLDPRTPGTEKTFSITMDPASLGRVKVTLEFGENNTVKAKLIAERPETLSLLQKDVAGLDRLLSSNGFDTSGADAFSFDLGNGDSFSQAMHDQGSQAHDQGGKSSGETGFGTESAFMETVIPVFVDPATGLTHVNITV